MDCVGWLSRRPYICMAVSELFLSSSRLMNSSPLCEPLPAEVPAAILDIVERADWAALAAFLDHCPSLEKFRIEVNIRLTDNDDPWMTEALALHLPVIDNVLDSYLTGRVRELSQAAVTVRGIKSMESGLNCCHPSYSSVFSSGIFFPAHTTNTRCIDRSVHRRILLWYGQ